MGAGGQGREAEGVGGMSGVLVAAPLSSLNWDVLRVSGSHKPRVSWDEESPPEGRGSQTCLTARPVELPLIEFLVQVFSRLNTSSYLRSSRVSC